MEFAIELFFDAASEERVRSYWRRMGNDYLLRLRATPHVTIGCFTDIPLARANEALHAAAQTIPPFPLTFQSVGMFTHPKPWLFLAPVVTRELLDVHARLFEAFGFCDSAKFPYYRPGQWVPHCAVCPARSPREFARAARVLARAHEPFTAQVVSMAWVEITRPMKVIGTAALCAYD